MRLALSGSDLAGKIGSIVPNWIIPGTKVPDRPVVAIGRVRFVGECVALVVAETQALAHDAIGLIDVDYETLPAVIDEEAAIRDGAPQLHDNVPNNITTVYKMGGGDYGKAAREADQVITLRIANNRLIPTCMETRSILAEPDVNGTLTLYLQSQVPHMHRRWIADTVGILRTSARGSSRRISAAVSAQKCISIPRSCSARIWRASSACPSSGGNRVPKAINPPTMAARTPRHSRSPSATTARSSA